MVIIDVLPLFFAAVYVVLCPFTKASFVVHCARSMSPLIRSG